VFTTTSPGELFVIGGPFEGTAEPRPADNVRISGIRLDGGQMGIASGDGGSKGIAVRNSVNVEIGNNEIYGWSNAGVGVEDDEAMPPRLNLENASAVWIHDNYIHHNRHWGTLGYGVVTGAAYALIERNVFDYNRHALAASGTSGTGYLAYHNLLLPGGGENCCLGQSILYTHQFDVHGTTNGINCGHGPWGYYCGDAGEYFDYRYNTSFYLNGGVIKLRGHPDNGADVAHNVFETDDPAQAFSQTDGDNLRAWNNRLGAVESFRADACDFDRDGLPDDFMATGATWWFRGATGHWHYLNTSTAHVGTHEEMTFQDDNHAGRCDVTVNTRITATGSYEQAVFSGGRAKQLVNGVEVAFEYTDLVWQPAAGTGDATVWVLAPHLNGVATELTVDLAADAQVIGTGDFNADGATDLLWRDAQGAVAVVLLEADGTVVEPLGGRDPVKGTMPLSAQVAGVGDFNADGRADILWRKDNGQLLLWLAGESGNSTLLNTRVAGAVMTPGVEDPISLLWKVEGVGDFNGDGFSDILFRHEGGAVPGQVSIWYLQHAMVLKETYPGGTDPGNVWAIEGIGDFNGDGRDDILWRKNDATLALSPQVETDLSSLYLNQPGTYLPFDWNVEGISDFTADGRADILWRHTNGTVVIWIMNGGTRLSESAQLPMATTWQLRGLLAQGFQRLDLQ
jgi:hypothetical protein